MTTADTPRTEAAAIALPPEALIIIPVLNLVLFPGLIAPLTLARGESIVAAQEAVKAQKPIGLLLQRDAATEEPGTGDLHTVGTVATQLTMARPKPAMRRHNPGERCSHFSPFFSVPKLPTAWSTSDSSRNPGSRIMAITSPLCSSTKSQNGAIFSWGTPMLCRYATS